MDAPGPTDHPVLPGGVRPVRRLHPGVRQQASLERRSDRSAAGGAHRCAHREFHLHTLRTDFSVSGFEFCK